MRRALALALPLLAGCFATDTRGALCTDNAQCGPGFRCMKDELAKTGRCGVPPSCPDHTLAIGETVFDFPGDYARKATCLLCDENDPDGVGSESQDVAYELTAETEGHHIFRTLGAGEVAGHPGSTFGTVLYAYLGRGCDNTLELAWDVNEFGEGANESLIVPYLFPGEVFTVVVDVDDRDLPPQHDQNDPATPDEDFFGLTSERLTGQCPDTTASGIEATLLADATGAGNTALTSCSAARSEDYTVGFSPSERALYSFTVDDSPNASVAVRSGTQCQSPEPTELACGTPVAEQLLEADEAVTVVVDGLAAEGPGSFVLEIEQCATYTPEAVPVTRPEPENDEEELPPETLVDVLAPLEGTTSSAADYHAPTCRPPDATTMPAVAALMFTAPESARFRFDTTGSSVTTRLAARQRTTCSGPDRACINVVDDPEDVLDLELTADETVVIVVETLGGPADYRLQIQRVFTSP